MDGYGQNGQNGRSGREPLIPKNGGYRNLKTFQLAQIVYDLTKVFCDHYIDKKSRTHDQMVQAARSGTQNIAEGSLASATSKKTELKLTNVARASLEELKLDYEDYLRQRDLPLWDNHDTCRSELIALRPANVKEVTQWIFKIYKRQIDHSTHAAISANTAHVLIGVASSLLKRQIDALAKAFETDGGFTERLYRVRRDRRNNPNQNR